MKIAILLVMVCCTFLSAENWYGYYYNNQPIGYAESSYEYDATHEVYHRKRTKNLLLPDLERTEEISAVLNADYTVRSLYFSVEEKLKQKTHQHFIIINVGKEITIQTATKIHTYPKKKFYLHLQDFLKFLLKRSPKVGRYYSTAVLSSNHLQLIKATARYKGLKKTYDKKKVHEFEVTSDELQSKWATAQFSLQGTLLSYRIANLSVVQTTRTNAIINKNKRIPTIYIHDVNSIDALQIFFEEAGQKSGRNVVIKRKRFPQSISLAAIQKNFSYLKANKMYPVNRAYIQQCATKARYGGNEPVVIVRNVVRWTDYHLHKTNSKYGNALRRIWRMNKDVTSYATATLCRANGIPAKVVSGWVYHAGFFQFESWCEVYLQKWLPVYGGKIDVGARFFASDKRKNMTIRIVEFTKNKARVVVNNVNSYVQYNESTIKDRLLGIEAIRPSDWVLLPKNSFTNILVLRSLKGKGPAILVKVLHSSKKLEDILRSLPQKLVSENLKILWTKKRKFQNIYGLEGALQSKDFVYRAFIGQRQQKIIFVLLFVPKAEFSNVEKEFFSFIASLKFTE
ncbi:transglutaminase-like domain-containing protein [Candidatus Uabimicrobium amorphum]|uniref:Transglutaminase-like domain-containing protein n=1 Tax=Uabimicrobium amorphum TaxID=2596890 RepID=A0A5S9F149_UABAM|nr:transglutaminase-like domain-containing protein [Candidatus Uabimicrobium amorphum]BBM81723.1 hypothetical protein UABAM_00062 [Candidatus Uabimicrobium amorphum]